MAQALSESRPEVGSSKNRSNLGLQSVAIRQGRSKRYCTYLCREFYSDGRSLSVLNAQRSHNGVGIPLQTAHFEYSFNADHSSVTQLGLVIRSYSLCFLFLERYRRRLPQFRGEKQGFAYGSLSQMRVHLLHVTAGDTPVYQHQTATTKLDTCTDV